MAAGPSLEDHPGAASPLLIENLSKSFAGIRVLDSVRLELTAGREVSRSHRK
jgi:ABC-type sugar transport system ATPase subunit